MCAATALVSTPAQLSVSDLRRAAADETTRYRRGDEHDDRYAFELFRRAIEERHAEAWEALLGLYNPQVVYWCTHARTTNDEIDELVSATWAKFWRSFTPEKLADAPQTSAVLRYLKLCAGSVAIDAGRRRTATVAMSEETLVEEAVSPIDDLLDQIAHELLWRVIEQQLNSPAERAFMRLAFLQGMKPAEVQLARPDLFPTAQEVYRTRHCVVNRLRRCPALRRWQETAELRAQC